MKDMTVPQFEKLVYQFLHKQTLPEQEEILFGLLSNDSYYSLYEYYVGLWLETDEVVKETHEYSTEVAYDRFVALADSLHKTPKRIRVLNVVRYAASVALILSLSWVVGKFITIDKVAEVASVGAPYSLTIPKGSQGELILPDGTHVWVNSGSKVFYYSDYNDVERNVYMEGEAYFEVAKDSLRPFVVHADDISIKALGTSFNVFTSSGEVITSLEEGCVEIDNSLAEKVVLKPGMQARYNLHDNTVSVEKLDVDAIVSWKEKKWIIRSMTLCDLAKRLERRYDVKIVFENSNLMEAKVSATFEDETVGEIFESLKTAFDLSVVKNDRIYVIR